MSGKSGNFAPIFQPLDLQMELILVTVQQEVINFNSLNFCKSSSSKAEIQYLHFKKPETFLFVK